MVGSRAGWLLRLAAAAQSDAQGTGDMEVVRLIPAKPDNILS